MKLIKLIGSLLSYLSARWTYWRNDRCWTHDWKKEWTSGGVQCSKCSRSVTDRKQQKLDRAKQRRGL